MVVDSFWLSKRHEYILFVVVFNVLCHTTTKNGRSCLRDMIYFVGKTEVLIGMYERGSLAKKNVEAPSVRSLSVCPSDSAFDSIFIMWSSGKLVLSGCVSSWQGPRRWPRWRAQQGSNGNRCIFYSWMVQMAWLHIMWRNISGMDMCCTAAVPFFFCPISRWQDIWRNSSCRWRTGPNPKSQCARSKRFTGNVFRQ